MVITVWGVIPCCCTPPPQVLAPLQGGLPQVLAPLQGGLPQQTGVIIQPQQVILTGNKVQQNAQVRPYSLVTTHGVLYKVFILIKYALV